VVVRGRRREGVGCKVEEEGGVVRGRGMGGGSWVNINSIL